MSTLACLFAATPGTLAAASPTMFTNWESNLQERLNELPPLLGGHMLLSVSAIAIGILISVPAGIFASRSRIWRGPVLTAAGIIQTIPGLALLALMVPLLGMIGFWPALVALTLYSILPILRNTVTGIAEVDANTVEAARAMGMTPGQVLRKVQLPLAAPVILAGVRTSSVWVIGTATLATPVGGESLGNYIFFGLATSNHLATLFGCVFAAGLAILFDLLIRGTEIAARRRSYVLGSAAGMALVAIVVVGLQPTLLPIGSDEHHSSAEVLNPGTGAAGVTDGQTKSGVSTAERLSGQKFVMGSKPFPESYVLADLIARQLSSAGAEVDLRPNMGSTILFDALRTNEVDAYVDYTGTIWTTVMKRDEAPGRLPVLIEVADFLKDNHGVICLGALGFENAYSLAMRRDRAQELGINSIADLARVAMINPLKIGGDPEIFGRPEWTRVRNAYNGLGSLQTVTMQSVFMYNAVRDGQVDVITAYSSDGRIAAYDLIVLDDPKQAFPPYDAILLLSPEAARTPGVVDALWPLVNSIPDDLMRRANMKVSVEKESPERAAGWLREEINSR